MNPITVLIVDDDKNSLHLSYSAMSQLVAPENIHCAENAAQTLDILKTHKIDLAFLDIDMPDTNGFSIAISLFLGAFVSLGVGIYWICSNLFSILQQMVLNMVIKPEKYIDYEDLAASKKELAAIENVGAGVSKEDKKREKADYKRFFSIANKHVVFYSEKSGFYKYFEELLHSLLAKSNLVIH